MGVVRSGQFQSGRALAATPGGLRGVQERQSASTEPVSPTRKGSLGRRRPPQEDAHAQRVVFVRQTGESGVRRFRRVKRWTEPSGRRRRSDGHEAAYKRRRAEELGTAYDRTPVTSTGARTGAAPVRWSVDRASGFVLRLPTVWIARADCPRQAAHSTGPTRPRRPPIESIACRA